jgi:hypothetical protein
LQRAPVRAESELCKYSDISILPPVYLRNFGLALEVGFLIFNYAVGRDLEMATIDPTMRRRLIDGWGEEFLRVWIVAIQISKFFQK